MPRIANFPSEMLMEHEDWHHRGRTVSQGALGSGEEFLNWHSRYIKLFNAWVDALPKHERPDPKTIAPWTEIPAILKTVALGWTKWHSDAEQRLQNMANFGTHDELGRFIEDGLHNRYLHGAAAKEFGEPDIADPAKAPSSTYFWQMHGLIERWSQEWLRTQGSLSGTTES
jgi:hypothetical protein